MTASRSVGERPGVGQRLRPGVDAHRHHRVLRGAEAALDDADAALDPRVVGLDALLEVVVGDDRVGLHAAEPEDAGARDGRRELNLHACSPIGLRGLLQVVRCVHVDDGRPLDRALDHPGQRARGRQLDDSVDAPRGEGVHAGVPAHRARHLGHEAVEELAAVGDHRAVGVLQQRVRGVRRGELVAVLADPGAQRLLGGLHEAGVERAGDRQRADPGALGRVLDERVDGVLAAGGDHLAGPVAVGRLEVELGETGEHGVGVTAEDGGHRRRLLGARGGHLPPAHGREGDGLLGVDDLGDRRGGELAHGVPGHHRVVGDGHLEPELVPREQRGRHEQRLGHGGVLDGGGVRLDTEVHEVEPGRVGERLEPSTGLGAVEPRGEHAGLLGALTGGEDRDHVVTSSRPHVGPKASGRRTRVRRGCGVPTMPRITHPRPGAAWTTSMQVRGSSR